MPQVENVAGAISLNARLQYEIWIYGGKNGNKARMSNMLFQPPPPPPISYMICVDTSDSEELAPSEDRTIIRSPAFTVLFDDLLSWAERNDDEGENG
jgi:hypothetical protein